MNALINQTIQRVSEALSVSPDKLMHSLCADTTAARHLCFKLLHEQGLAPRTIAAYFCVTPRAVSLALTAFDVRCKHTPYLRRTYEAMRKQ